MSGVHEDTVENMVQVFKELGIVRVKNQYNVRKKKYDDNHYTLLMIGGAYTPQVPDEPTQIGEPFPQEAELGRTSKSVALSKKRSGAKLPPAATAASPLALRGNSAPRSGDNGLAAGAVGDFDTCGNSAEPHATPTAAELEAAAKAEEERLAAEAAQRAEQAQRWQEERRRQDEQIEADRRAKEQADRIRRQGDHRECMKELLALLDRADFDPTDYSGGLQIAVEFYRPDVMRAALADLWEPLAGRWRQAEAVMIKEGAIAGPIMVEGDKP